MIGSEFAGATPVHTGLAVDGVVGRLRYGASGASRSVEVRCGRSVEKGALVVPRGELREALTEQIETLFGRLRGQALLVATLSYSLGVRISQLKTVKVRDVHIAERFISVGGRERMIPSALVEDLKEHLHERLCGCEATGGLSRREQGLFSLDAFEALRDESERLDQMFRDKFSAVSGRRARVCFDSRLRIVGWFHKRRAAARGVRCASAIELFDKGPRIVRRGFRGAIDAYYVWRASRVLFS